MSNGISVLYPGDPKLPIEVDIIFVHGLKGDSMGTWSKGTVKDGTAVSVCWPRDVLPGKFKTARTLTWGYDSSVFKIKGPSSQSSIFQHAENLLTDLVSTRDSDEEENRPIIFVGHSLGGLVIKEALIKACSFFHTKQDEERGKIYEMTEGVVFFGTPHRGSDATGIAEIVSTIAKIAGRPNDKLIEVLKRESQILENQNGSFTGISQRYTLVCLAEEKPTGIGRASVMVVPKMSATLDGYNVKKGDINANHSDMCKFSDEKDDGFIRFAVFISSMMKGIRRKAKDLLDSLRFPHMNFRETDVVDAWTKTFEWLVPGSGADPVEAHPEQMRRFTNWIRSDRRELFWISGNAGSGKSTLMKKLFSHHALRRQIQEWAAPNAVSFAAFYFFDRGSSPLQKSREGLLRALLHQLVHDNPRLAILLRTYASSIQSSTEDGGERRIDWSWETLYEAFNLLIMKQQGIENKTKFCLFLDGLDEYSALDTPSMVLPSTEEHQDKRRQSLLEIRKLVLELANSPLIKICVSSRPLNAFNSVFGAMPLIQLHDLTAQDIHRFIRGKFDESPAWLAFSHSQNKHAAELISNIVRKASGVFLWVTIVVDRILEELENGSRHTELQRLVDSLPQKLHLLYEKMLRDVRDDHRDQGVRLFHLFLASRYPPTATFLHFADTMTTKDVLSYTSDSDHLLRSEDNDKLTEKLRNRLRSRCAGLLDISSKPAVGGGTECRVHFLHQTVKEYLKSDSAWPNTYLRRQQNPDSTSLGLLRASIMALKTTRWKFMEESGFLAGWELSSAWNFVYDAMYFAKLLDCKEEHKQTLLRLLDDLDLTGSRVFERERRRISSTEHWASTRDSCCRADEFTQSNSDDFLSLAIEADLYGYISQKLQNPIQRKEAQPYLEYAVAPTLMDLQEDIHGNRHEFRGSFVMGPSKPEVVKLLLDHGADPNYFFRRPENGFPSTTVWGRVLFKLPSVMLFPKDYVAGDPSTYGKRRQLPQFRPRWIENIKLLIRAGADPNLQVPINISTYVHDLRMKKEEIPRTPVSILQFALKNYPRERDEILLLLRDQVNWLTPMFWLNFGHLLTLKKDHGGETLRDGQ